MSIAGNSPTTLPGPLPTLGTELPGALLLADDLAEVVVLVGGSGDVVGSAEVAGLPPEAVPEVFCLNRPAAAAVITPAATSSTTTAVMMSARRPPRRAAGGGGPTGVGGCGAGGTG